jgi:hypothetical protein
MNLLSRDLHYFDGGGECIACSAFKGPWSDDDEGQDEEE